MMRVFLRGIGMLADILVLFAVIMYAVLINLFIIHSL